jgi:hypothetical protein
MAGKEVLDHGPAALCLHAQFFAEGSPQINRKAGGVNLPQPSGLKRSPFRFSELFPKNNFVKTHGS